MVSCPQLLPLWLRHPHFQFLTPSFVSLPKEAVSLSRAHTLSSKRGRRRARLSGVSALEVSHGSSALRILWLHSFITSTNCQSLPWDSDTEPYATAAGTWHKAFFSTLTVNLILTTECIAHCSWMALLQSTVSANHCTDTSQHEEKGRGTAPVTPENTCNVGRQPVEAPDRLYVFQSTH